MLRVDTYLPADGAYNGIVVARKDFYLYTIFMQLSDSFGCRWFGWVQERKVSDEYHVVFVLGIEVVVFADKAFLRYSQHPHSGSVHLFADGSCLLFQFRSEQMYFTVVLGMRADGKHFFHGSFCDDLPFAGTVFYYDRHTAAVEVERNFVYLQIIVCQVLHL